LGMIAGKRGDHFTALGQFEDALNRARQIGRRDAEMLYLNNLGGAQVRLEQYDEADTNLSRVIAMSEETPFGQVSETYYFLAEVQLRQGRIPDALASGLRALELGRQSRSAEVIVMVWRILGQIAACLPDPITIKKDDGGASLPGFYTAES